MAPPNKNQTSSLATSATSSSRLRDILNRTLSSRRIHKKSGVIKKYRCLPGAPSLPVPRKDSWQAQRVQQDLQEHDAAIDPNAVCEKCICECPARKDDPRYNVFKHTGPIGSKTWNKQP